MKISFTENLKKFIHSPIKKNSSVSDVSQTAIAFNNPSQPKTGSSVEAIKSYMIGMSNLKYNLEVLPTKLFSAATKEKTLEKIGQKTQSSQVETLHLMDSKGKLISSVMGTTDQVNLKKGMLSKIPNGTVIHNHPSDSKILGENTLSIEDIETTAKANISEAVVYSNGRKYTIKFPEKYDKSKLLNRLEDVRQNTEYADKSYEHKQWTKMALWKNLIS